MARFSAMVDDFKSYPPAHETARASILMPGDKGYPKPRVDKEKARQAVKQTVKPAGPEPQWMRDRRLKEERKRQGGLSGR